MATLIEKLLLKYALSRSGTAREILRVGQQVLSRPEYEALREQLRHRDSERFPQKQSEGCYREAYVSQAGKSAIEKLARYFEAIYERPGMDRGPPADSQREYTVDELVAIAEGQKTNLHLSRPLLNKNLLKFCSEYLPFQSLKGKPSKFNLWRVLGHAYGVRIRKLNPLVRSNRKLKRVVDLYFLSDREFRRLAFPTSYTRVPCGRKTFEALDQMLQSLNLPTRRQVTRTQSDRKTSGVDKPE